MANKKKGVKRRKFLKYTGAGLALMIGGTWLARNPIRRTIFEQGEKTVGPYMGDTSPLLWVEISPENEILLHSSKVEMGQGTFTGLAQLVAEELEVTLDKIKVVHATTGSGNIDGLMTGGSYSIASLWMPLRKLGATMRVMLQSKAWRFDFDEWCIFCQWKINDLWRNSTRCGRVGYTRCASAQTEVRI